MSLWNSDTGNLIQEVTLPHPTTDDPTFLHKFQIEDNHLVLLVRRHPGHFDSHYQLLIYELDQVLAGAKAIPRQISLDHHRSMELLVDKTSIMAAFLGC